MCLWALYSCKREVYTVATTGVSKTRSLWYECNLSSWPGRDRTRFGCTCTCARMKKRNRGRDRESRTGKYTQTYAYTDTQQSAQTPVCWCNTMSHHEPGIPVRKPLGSQRFCIKTLAVSQVTHQLLFAFIPKLLTAVRHHCIVFVCLYLCTFHANRDWRGFAAQKPKWWTRNQD